MKLKLTASSGPTFEMNYESMVDYDQPLLDPGSYTAKFMYGDPATEGPTKPTSKGRSPARSWPARPSPRR